MWILQAKQGDAVVKNVELQKSLVEQIIEEMFASLEGKEPFTPPTIQALKELAQRGDLSKATQVAKIIKAGFGGQP